MIYILNIFNYIRLEFYFDGAHNEKTMKKNKWWEEGKMLCTPPKTVVMHE